MTSLLLAPAIPAIQLLWLFLPLAAVYWVLRDGRLGVERRLLSAAARGGLQLTLVGYVLAPLFGLGHLGVVFAVLALMCGLAAFFSLGLLGKGPGLRLWLPSVFAILPVVLGLTAFATFLVLDAPRDAWARTVLGLGGMFAGSAMNAVALSGDRFLSSLAARRGELETWMCLGATGPEAARGVVADAMRVAVTPSLQSLIAVGLVSFPGMMTGQILAGEHPLPAARYQMLIMALWVASAALSSRVFLYVLTRALLGDHRVRWEEQREATPSFRVAEYAPDPKKPPRVFDQRPGGSRTQ